MSDIQAYDDRELVRLGEGVAAMLTQRGQMMVTAESCTGGWIAKVLTDIPGSSAWFEAGLVAYSYEAKEALLGVNPRTLERTGAVSQETVIEMVSGALARYGASVAVAVTGIAGPGGATPGKPVGTVWIGWKRRGGYARAQMFHFDGDREAVRRQTVAAALAGIQKILST
jgi:nicotinamide-nucleotide amidase